ncbi:MAG: VIT domain-containing protein [candidate division KSB1 bacterium]|mgnify:CR=1 FL=1
MKYFLAAVALCASTVYGQGIIVRPDFHPAALELRRHNVRAEVHEQIAVVTVEHEFYNPGATTVEGTFLFPLPPQAQISRFAMHVEGKEMVGELLTADEARRIYENIVRQNLDPALLEMADYRTFRARIFPIPPRATRLLTLRYDATLPREGNTVSFQYPMSGNLSQRNASGGGPSPWPQPFPDPRPMPPESSQRPERAPAQQSTIQIELRTETGLRNIYSPSHRVEVKQSNDRRATVSYEASTVNEGKDFLLYYALDANEIGATLLTHRPEAGQPGYFMLLLAPQVEAQWQQIAAKDLVLVLDTSGSMAGEKITQAKAALRYCLQRLGERDRFGVVTFSSEARRFRPQLATVAAREDALWHVDKLEATGGTNINEALRAAADLLRDSKPEQSMIIFLTDGLPTNGVTEEAQIRRNFKQAQRGAMKLFSFGVGFDVNTRLLDGLAKENHAFADYIAPQENIEERVSTFYEKVRYPVLSNLEYEFRGADVRLLSPGRLPDLFKGGQIILAGRYHSAGRATLHLRGQTSARPQALQYDFNFPAREREREFVARLWATRRVGDLLEEIRMNGENEELKSEVVALAKEFGLVTPYTSYLVQEEESMQPVSLQQRSTRTLRRMQASPESMPQSAPDLSHMAQTSGAGAVAMSKSIREMKEAGVVTLAPASRAVTIQGRVLTLATAGVWSDGEYRTGTATLKLAFASEAYFSFLRLYPQARDFCKLGQKVVFKFRGQFVEVGESGEKQMSEEKLRALHAVLLGFVN